jgi:hypothetical protein
MAERTTLARMPVCILTGKLLFGEGFSLLTDTRKLLHMLGQVH